MFKTVALNSVANEYVDKDDSTSTPGTRLEAADRNITQDEPVAMVESSGQTLDPTGVKRTQVARAAFLNGVGAQSLVDSGGANAKILVPVTGVSGYVFGESYAQLTGAAFMFKNLVANTGATTINVGQTAGTLIGVKSLTRANGAALTGGELIAGSYNLIFYDLANDRFELVILSESQLPPGVEMFWPAATPPSGWLEEDGALYSMDTYENLLDIILDIYGVDSGVVFTSNFSTDILTSNTHGKSDGEIITLSNSGGALPANLGTGTKYFIISATTDTFQVSLTSGGSAVDFSDNGSGTHYFHSQMKVPDMRGEFPRGWDHGAGNDPDAAGRTDRGDGTTGDNIGTKQPCEIESHAHAYTAPNGGGGIGSGGTTANCQDISSETTGGNETRGRNVNKMFIIKY